MVSQRIHKPSPWTVSRQGKISSFAPRPFAVQQKKTQGQENNILPRQESIQRQPEGLPKLTDLEIHSAAAKGTSTPVATPPHLDQSTSFNTRGMIQRQIIATKQNDAGTFTFDHNSNTKTKDDTYVGVDIEISFKLNDQAANEDRLYLSQISKVLDLSSNSLYNFADSDKAAETAEAARDLVRTTGAHGEDAGFFIDNVYATTGVGEEIARMNTPRDSTADDQRSAAYNMTGSESHGHDGRKTDLHSSAATLKDTPRAGKPTNFQFETVALGSARRYGTLPWNVVLGTKNEPNITVGDATSQVSKNYTEALFKFDEFFRNRGAATSPERFKALIDVSKSGLSGFNEAVRTLDQLTSRVQTLQSMPASEATIAMITNLKETIRYRFEAINEALTDNIDESVDLKKAALYREKVAEYRKDAVRRIGAL